MVEPRRRDVPSLFDRAVILVLLTRLVFLLSAPITLWLIATRRPLSEQAPYFVFWNTQAFTQLMELGVGGLIVQFASHQSAGVSWDSQGGLVGDPSSERRMYALIREGQRWYGLIAVLTALLAGVGGSLLFEMRSSSLHRAPFVPWLITVLSTALYLPLVPALCAIEGCGGLLRVQRMRLVQATVAMIVLWAVLVRWDALWAVAAFGLVWLLVAFLWLIVTHRGLMIAVRSSSASDTHSLAEGDLALTPVQWRTGASWISSWAVPQALTPIVLASQGAASAGQVGMSLAIATAPLTLASAWLQGRYPRYGALVARGERHDLKRVASIATVQAMLVCGIGTAMATAVVAFLSGAMPILANRALPAVAIAILGVANLAWLAVQSLASYLRAWREEPLMEATVIGASFVIIGTLGASRYASAQDTVLAYSLLMVFGMIPLAVFGFRRHHQRSGENRYGLDP